MRDKADREKIIRTFALIVWASIILLIFLNRDKITVDAIISYSPENLFLAALVMLGFFALKTLSVFFYSGILYTANGFLFSLPVAVLMNLLGTLVMIIGGYYIGLGAGSHLAEEIMTKYKKLQTISRLRESRPLVFSLLVRMLKVVSYGIGSLYLGATRTKLLPYIAGSLIGMSPEVILYAFVGRGIHGLDAAPVLVSAAIYGTITLISALILRKLAIEESGADHGTDWDK